MFSQWRRAKGESEEEKKAHERFSDDEYQHIRDIPVFKEHSYFRTLRDKNGPILDADGNPKQVIETYGFDELKSIVDNCNKRVRDTKSFAPVTALHTGKRKPDGTIEQPEIMGFAGPFRLGMYGNEDRTDGAPFKGKWTIYADEFWFKDKAHRAREMPRRSPEIYVGRPIHDRFLDPITALGAETPALDMGIHYHLNKAGELVEQYSAPNITVRYAGYKRSAEEIKAEIKEHKKSMKERGIPITSHMNRLPPEHSSANAKLFALKTELDDAPSSKKIGASHVHTFMQEHGVTKDDVHGWGPETRKTATGMFNKKHKSEMTPEEFHEHSQTAQYQAAAMPGASNVAIAQPVQEKNKTQYDEWDDASEALHNKSQEWHRQGIEESRKELNRAQETGDQKAIRHHSKILAFHEKELEKNADAHELMKRKRELAPAEDHGTGKLELSLRTALSDEFAKYSADPDTVNACVNAMMNTQIIQRIQTFIDSHDAPVNPKEEMENALATGIDENDPDVAVIAADGEKQPPAGEMPPEAAEEEDDGSGDALPDPTGKGDTPDEKGTEMADTAVDPKVAAEEDRKKEKYEMQEFMRDMKVKYDQQQAQIVELQTANNRLVGERNQAVRERKIIELRQKGYAIDVKNEIAHYSQASEDVFQARLDAIVQYGQQAPINGPQLLVDSIDPPEPQPDVMQYGGASQSETEQIIQYQLKKQQEGEYLSWEEAKEAWEEKQDKKARKAAKAAAS